MLSLLSLLNEEEIVVDSKFTRQLEQAVKHLSTKNKVLLLTTSNRGKFTSKDGQDMPKSTRLARVIQRSIGEHKCTLVDVSMLKIYSCEGNVSSKDGNTCGVKASKLKDDKKNPTGQLRCWASYNNPDDELWKVVTPLLESDAVVFLGSIRWGQTNAIYQELIERLNWIENRHTTLGEKNIIKDIESGFIFLGHNWRNKEVTQVQKQVHEFYGFKPVNELYFGYQFTTDIYDESKEGYKEDVHSLDNIFDIRDLLK
jgi:multimeric flavodoxin WrbA